MECIKHHWRCCATSGDKHFNKFQCRNILNSLATDQLILSLALKRLENELGLFLKVLLVSSSNSKTFPTSNVLLFPLVTDIHVYITAHFQNSLLIKSMLFTLYEHCVLSLWSFDSQLIQGHDLTTIFQDTSTGTSSDVECTDLIKKHLKKILILL